ncbi:hypothetical protein CL629_02305 [bacterium]|nr:hypothetical protein [bacterium]
MSARKHHDKMMARHRMPRLDRSRYTDLSSQGLEGPFQFKGGEVLYYDPKEGKYYDRDTDMFLSNRDADRIVNYTGKRNEGVEEMSLQSIIEGLESKLLEYRMPEEEQEKIADKVKELRLKRDHLNVLKFLFLGKNLSPKEAVSSRELVNAFGASFKDSVLKTLTDNNLIKGVPSKRSRHQMSGYYATLDGHLMGHAFQRGYLKKLSWLR